MSDYAMEKIAQVQVHDTVDQASQSGRSTGSDVDPVMRLIAVTDAPLDVAVHEAATHHPRAGGRVVFSGVVRDRDHDRDVVGLEYEGHPTAQGILTEVAEKFASHPDVLALAVSHRVGVLAVGDVALVAVVATEHRREAFTVCAEFVDEVKHRLPIWKRQVFSDGTDEWVNCP